LDFSSSQISHSFVEVGLTGLWRALMGLNFDHAAHLGGLTTGFAYSYAVYSINKAHSQKTKTRN
jgi:membrane associated rhomboid family serine protease